MEPKKSSRLPKKPRTPHSEPVVNPKEAEGEWEDDPEEAEGEWEEDPEEAIGEGEEVEEDDSEETEDDEVEEESEEETEVEEREDDKSKNSPFQPSQVRKKHIIQKQSNLLQYSDTKHKKEVWEESNSPRSPSPSNFTIMPITKKRPASKDPEDDEKYSRGKKKTKTNEEEERKDKFLSAPVAGGRVWCQEDEVTILKGIIEYKNKEGVYPPNDMIAFYEFVREKLYGDVSRNQLSDKVKRLKKKFLVILEKIDQNIEPVLSKPHDYIIFDLSKKIWSRNSMGNPSGSTAAKVKGKRSKPSSSTFKEEVEKREESALGDLKTGNEDLHLKYPYLSESLCREGSNLISEMADTVKISVKDKLSLIGKTNAEELEKEWKKLREGEADIFLKKMNLIARQTQLMLEGAKK